MTLQNGPWSPALQRLDEALQRLEQTLLRPSRFEVLLDREQYLKELESGFGIPPPPSGVIMFRRPRCFEVRTP
jgi:hypothetical protein